MEQKIIDAVERFEAVVNSLECECDEYHGYTCTIHTDRILAKEALAIIASQPADAADKEGVVECWYCHRKYGRGCKCSICGREGR